MGTIELAHLVKLGNAFLKRKDVSIVSIKLKGNLTAIAGRASQATSSLD
jgi:hypothetical protein